MGRNLNLICATWGKGTNAPEGVRDSEHHLEIIVTEVIGEMPFLWLGIGDNQGGHTCRDYLERHSIALLSNYRKPALDPPSPNWLGRYCRSDRVRDSGLWLSDYVDDAYGAAFLDQMETLVREVGKS